MQGGFLTSLSPKLNFQEIRDQAQRSLGGFFMAFASIELNLTLRVGDVGDFNDKLERFLNIALVQFGENSEHYWRVLTWYVIADSVRETRNRFAHGRWGFIPTAQVVIHVSGYPPAEQVEQRYSLDELDLIVKDVEILGEELLSIT